MKSLAPLITLLYLFTIFISQVTPARILAIFLSGTASHKIAFDPLLEELAAVRGHQITVLTIYRTMKEPVANLTQILCPTFEELFQQVTEGKRLPNFIEMRLKGEENSPGMFLYLVEICKIAYDLPQLDLVLNQTFDLVLMDPIMSEALYPIMDHFNTPKIFLTSMPTAYWIASAFGTPTLPSFVPAMFSPVSAQMNLWNRLKNTIMHAIFNIAMEYYLVPKFEETAKNKLPNARSSHEIKKDVNLIIENTHVSLNVKRPLTPDIVDAGGLHCRDPKPLPKDLQEFADNAGPEGFILFSMGSVGHASEMPEQLKQLFANAFSKLKVKILWKWSSVNSTTTHESNIIEIDGFPSNVKLSNWLPQQDVLGHPNCKLFLTHGGLLSLLEAIYHGVPLLGFPMFGDQDSNLQQATDQGIALWLEIATLTEEQLINTITKMLEESKFRKAMKKKSILYKDNLVNPLEKAVFWVEYILRHGGAPHLRSAGRDLNFIQFYSLDSIGILVITLFAVFYSIYFALKVIFLKLISILGFRKAKSKSE